MAGMKRKVVVTDDNLVIDFTLSVQELTLGEVIVKKGEDLPMISSGML